MPPPLDLAEAQRLALSDDPGLGAVQARAQALEEDAVAEGQLPDPKLRLGMYNLPLDSLSVSQEPTTQLRLGVQQAFPRGQTLHYRQLRSEWRSKARQARARETESRILRNVREAFLELYYQIGAERLVLDRRGLFTQLVDVTQSQYASGNVKQQDVLRAQLELARLDDRLTRLRNSEEVRRANLAKWIGEAAQRPLASEFPELPPLPGYRTIEALLERHPVIGEETAEIESREQSVHIAKEQYKPGWTIGAEYRKRFGDNPDSSDRTDMLAAMLTIDMPLFPKNRQDRRLLASQKQADAARLVRLDRLRGLKAELDREYANWKRLGERSELYRKSLLRDAKSNAQASLSAYQSGVTEFTTLMRARITELDVLLEELRIRVDRAKARVRLLYLSTGEEL